jgi:uncharacterized protein (TIGR03000 family)
MKSGVNAARVLIKAPADAHITVNGRETPHAAAEETFRTPELEPGHTYEYVVKAEATRGGKTVTLTREVTVRAGRQSVADFTELGESQGSGEAARVTLRVPEDARVFIDGVLCPLTSATRRYQTPRLEAGRQYFYTVKAELTREGRTLSESRRVLVEAGKQVTVEFSDLAAVQAAQR